MGFFDKVKNSDIFVLYDCAQYVNRNFHQRNRIRISEGNKWINVPVHRPRYHDKTPIQDISIKSEETIKGTAWNEHMLKVIADNYRRADFFEEFFPGLEEILRKPGENLSELNTRLINYLARTFEIETMIISTKELPQRVNGKDATEKIVNMCKDVGANAYLSGAGGRNYMDESQFERNGLGLVYQDYKHPTYKQNFPGFVPYMAAIDALFCVGKIPEEGTS